MLVTQSKIILFFDSNYSSRLQFDDIMAHTNKIKTLLSDLGRSTKRGIKKCPSCGTYNGTRTVVCKSCYLLLKPNNKKVSPSEVCLLLTSSASRVYFPFELINYQYFNGLIFQIFSYISSENIDFNEKGFVHFPDARQKEINKLDTGICLVRSCGRSFDSNVLKCHVSKCYFIIIFVKQKYLI